MRSRLSVGATPARALDRHMASVDQSSSRVAYQQSLRGLERRELPSDRGWLKRVHFRRLAGPESPVSSDRQSHGQDMVGTRMPCMLGASPSGVIRSVAVRYSQVWLRALHSGARD